MNRIFGAASVLTVLVAVAACGVADADGRSPAAAPPATAPAATPTPTTSATPEPDPAALQRIVLRRSDVRDTPFVTQGELSPRVRSLDTPSLDFCGGPFPSEQQRVAQYAVELDGKIDGETSGILSFAVQYTSERAATAAVDELENAVEHCDGRPHRSIFSDGEPVVFEPGQMSDAVKGLPLHHYLVGSRLTLADGSFSHVQLLMAASGRYATIAFIVRGSGITDGAGEVLSAVVGRTATRLDDEA